MFDPLFGVASQSLGPGASFDKGVCYPEARLRLIGYIAYRLFNT